MMKKKKGGIPAGSAAAQMKFVAVGLGGEPTAVNVSQLAGEGTQVP